MYRYIGSNLILDLVSRCTRCSGRKLVRNYATPPKRFYKNTNILRSDKKFEIILDQRKLKTPKGNIFAVESEPLALAIATEWNLQKDKIIQSKMHLEDEKLLELQVNEWDPLIEWFNKRFGVHLKKSSQMDVPPVSDQDKTALSKYLMSYNFAAVNGFMYGVDTLKSVVLTLAATERFVTPEKAVLLSRLEEEYQLGHWGRVEWAHDLNQQDLQARLSAVVLFVYFNSQSNIVQSKI
nr:unnamed protein product [Callosobruchus chinensis]